MAQLAPHHLFTFADYLRVEEESGVRHELVGETIVAMAGGSPEHAAIGASVIHLLNVGLAGKRCRVISSDLRVRVAATGLVTYPDASVVCGALELDPEDPKGHTAVNPTVLVEVLGPSTAAYDRGEKLAHYRRIPSLREIVLVAHGEPHLEIWRRVGDDDWSRTSARPGEIATLESLGCGLAVEDVYRDPLASP